MELAPNTNDIEQNKLMQNLDSKMGLNNWKTTKLLKSIITLTRAKTRQFDQLEKGATTQGGHLGHHTVLEGPDPYFQGLQWRVRWPHEQ